jgi:hypothetical protein
MKLSNGGQKRNSDFPYVSYTRTLATIMKKGFYILICAINILLVIDFIVLGLLRDSIGFINSFSIIWNKPDFFITNDKYFTVLEVETLTKLILLSIVIFLIIFERYNIFSRIILKLIILIYGISFVYQFIFCDTVSFQFSSFIKFLIIIISILFLHNYFDSKNDSFKKFHFLSKRITVYLMITFLVPFLIFLPIQIIGDYKIDKDKINRPTQIVVDSLIGVRNKLDQKILIDQKPLLNYKSLFFSDIDKLNISLFDKLFMYFQINSDRPYSWDCNKISNTVCCLLDYSRQSWDIIDTLSKVEGTPFLYSISKPLLNYHNNIAYIRTFSIFLPEATGRYSTSKTFILEKRFNKWYIKIII